jgi:hypothetical protein
MVVVPNPTKSHVFTLKEMIAATQTFSHEIGRGGFGSVFLGKLPQGEDIAVKVLSQSSQQGVHEFLNEVILIDFFNPVIRLNLDQCNNVEPHSFGSTYE